MTSVLSKRLLSTLLLEKCICICLTTRACSPYRALHNMNVIFVNPIFGTTLRAECIWTSTGSVTRRMKTPQPN